MANLVNEILNSPWMIDRQYALSMQSHVIRLIQGKTVSFGQPDSIPTNFINANGNFSAEAVNDQKQVAVVSIKGAITKYNQMCGPEGTLSINNTIKALSDNPNVAAIVLDMDTPGGQASFLNTLASTIKQTTSKKPVLAYYSGLCASAGYYIASACDEIYASEKNDIVGSIGTMITFLDFSEKMKNEGIKLLEIYADQSTNKNKMFSEALKGNDKLLKENLLNPFAQDFIDTVKSNREINNEDVFTGGTYMSTKAIELNLIDGVKSFDQVISRAFDLSEKNTNSINTNNKTEPKTNNMKKNILTVAAFLGFEALESTDGHVSLREEDVAKIGEALAKANTDGAGTTQTETIDLENDPKIIELENSINGIKNQISGIGTQIEEITSLMSNSNATTATTTKSNDSALDAGTKKVEAWNDPNNQFNKALAEDLGEDAVPGELGA